MFFFYTVLEHYCETYVFQAEYPTGTIIMIEKARYGRIELGMCLITDFGFLNCYRYDTSYKVSAKCTGYIDYMYIYKQ